MFINSSQGELSKTVAFLMFSFIILYSDVQLCSMPCIGLRCRNSRRKYPPLNVHLKKAVSVLVQFGKGTCDAK